MRNFGAFAFLVLALFATTHAAQSAPAGAASKEELAKMYQRYFNTKDIEKLESLVYWPGAAPRERDTFVRSVQSDLHLRLKNVEFDSIDSSEVLEYTVGGVKYRPTLAPVARLIATYEGRGSPSTSYLVGVKKNRYYITLASRASKSSTPL